MSGIQRYTTSPEGTSLVSILYLISTCKSISKVIGYTIWKNYTIIREDKEITVNSDRVSFPIYCIFRAVVR